MELMTPQILWKDFDTQAPFDETIVRYSEDRHIKEFYFSGLRTADGVVRIYAKYLHNGDGMPTIVYFGEENEQLEIPTVKNHNFLIVDYTGVRKGKARGTLYPYSLKDAERDKPMDNLAPRESRWYAWASVAMYAVLYAQRYCGNGKVGVIGIGQGGSLVWKLSACVSVDVGVTVFSAGYEPNKDDIYYRACLDNRSYAPLLKFPIMEIVSSNESDGSIDFMSEVFSAVKRKDCRLCINERSNHTLGEDGRKNIELWLSNFLVKEAPMPDVPVLRPYESGGKLYYEVKYNGNPDAIDFYTSVGNSHGALRNWSKVGLMRLEDSYLTSVKVFDVNAPINAFVTIHEFGYKISSVVISRVPSSMKIVPDKVKRNRLIYDSDMGVDDWAAADNDTPIMKEGPFGISGVCSPKVLITFKLADVRYKGADGNLLQIMFCSCVKQKIDFAITDSRRRTFLCSFEGDLQQGWITANFKAEDFKSDSETLMTWNDIVTFEVRPSAGLVLVSSLLWV